MTSANTTDAAATIADRFLSDNDIAMAAQHRRNLAWLVERFGTPVAWLSDRKIPRGQRLIVVIEPLTGPQADAFYRALHADSVVVIPYSENPAFDFLKSKLKDFGTIGASAHDGAHELWWGGLKWAEILPSCPRTELPLIASCYPRDRADSITGPLRASLKTLKLDAVIEPVTTREPGKLHGADKAAFLLNLRKNEQRPILWVDPDSRFEVFPSLITKIACDFAVHKWNRWEMSTRTLYFGSGPVAGDFLQTWHEFASTYSMVWDGYVLDQAWSLVSSQAPLNTVWLPRSYHGTLGEPGPRHTSVVVHNIEPTILDLGEEQGFPKALRPARRASRIGAPEALVVVKSKKQDLHGAVTVILGDIQSASARDVAQTIDAVVGAFHQDCGGFGQLELSLCFWSQDVSAATSVARAANNRILQVTPLKKPGRDLFRRFAETADSCFNVVPLSGAASAS
jgi:hypothetical protein